MPFFLLIALFVAFGFDDPPQVAGVSRPEIGPSLAKALGGIASIGASAFLLNGWLIRGVARLGQATASLRRRYVWGARLLEVLTLVVYGWLIHDVGWPRVVRVGFGLGGIPVVDDALILLPYVLMLLAGWWATYPAERSLRTSRAIWWPDGQARNLTLRARQTLGLVLPVLLVYSLGQDALRLYWPQWNASTWAQPIEVAIMGATVLALSPLFVRAAWPTRPLPPGPLRSRLEHLARRHGFRCSEILVWDTGQVLINACVTGTLPWFRYVLLSDALIEYLNEHEVAAVFGHELGHIAHRHLLYFGLFFAASLGIFAPFNGPIDEGLTALTTALAGRDHPLVGGIVEAAAILAVLGLYVLLVFGFLSRRFERQADIFGCQAVSCGQADCPPHADLDGMPGEGPRVVEPCPVGIRIFANALANVAALNGIDPRARSWRHGSIARRIAFLEGLEGNPGALRTFQLGVSRLRVAVVLALVASLLIAAASGSIH